MIGKIVVLLICAIGSSAIAQQGAAAAVAELNRIRVEHGLDPVELDPILSDAAQKHASYLRKNQDQIAQGLEAHDEIPGRPGYTPEGAIAGKNSDIYYGAPGELAVKAWYRTYYHRNPMLSSGVGKIGYGSVPFKNGMSIVVTQFKTFTPVTTLISPPPDSVGQPTAGNQSGENPSPVPGFGPRRGNPIIAYVGGPELKWRSSTIRKGEKELAHFVIAPNLPKKEPNKFFENDEIVLITKKPLPMLSNIEVTLTFERDGKEEILRWVFRTGL